MSSEPAAKVGRRRSWLRCTAAALLLCLTGLFISLLVALIAFWISERRSPRLACLMYHRFVSDKSYAGIKGTERIYSMPVGRFEDQLRQLHEAGYASVSLDDALAFARGERGLPQSPVLITIDDGCESDVTMAGPLLARNGFRATLFVTSDPNAYVFDAAHGGQPRISDAQLAHLDPRIFDLGSHGATHASLRDMTEDRITRELRESKASLERASGRRVSAMAVPGNWYDARVLRLARQVGYEAVFTSDRGAVHAGDDLFRLSRLNVAGYESADQLIRSLTPLEIAKQRLARSCREIPRSLFSGRVESALRSVIAEIITPERLSPAWLMAATMVLGLGYWGIRRRKAAV